VYQADPSIRPSLSCRHPLLTLSLSQSIQPITLFIIQLFIIIVFTQGLGWAFSYINQPKVIAEVVGGIILGPTVMGRIPDFTFRIFPQPSLPYLNLIATIGLILFLFTVGVEVDPGVMKRNGRDAGLISIVGMVVPFGFGAAIAVPIYNNFVDHAKVSFGHFLLFVGVAISITAFPVLCRILTSCKLLDTKVGVIVLAAGVGNDVVGWVLLALTLALVNSGTGVTAVYVLLCAVGWTLILLFPVKRGFYWLARRSGSLDNGPTPMMMVLTLLIVFASAFLTGIIGELFDSSLVSEAHTCSRGSPNLWWICRWSDHPARRWICYRFGRKDRRSCINALLTYRGTTSPYVTRLKADSVI
jgi:Kef-type K+ transport system membrane component KefB